MQEFSVQPHGCDLAGLPLMIFGGPSFGRNPTDARMLIGIFAALLSFTFLKIAGEPSVDRAIAFEAQMNEAKAQARKEEAAAKGCPLRWRGRNRNLSAGLSRPGLVY